MINYLCIFIFAFMLLFYILLTQTHIASNIGIKDLPLLDKLYSALGGICGYSFLINKLSFSNSFKVKLNAL